MSLHVNEDGTVTANAASEVDKLWGRMREQGIRHMHVSIAPGATPTAEEIAAELNQVNEHLSNPRNRLIARLGGQAFLLRDSIHCTENKFDVRANAPVPMTADQRYRVRRDKEMLELIEAAMEMLRADGDEARRELARQEGGR